MTVCVHIVFNGTVYKICNTYRPYRAFITISRCLDGNPQAKRPTLPPLHRDHLPETTFMEINNVNGNILSGINSA